MVNIFNKTIKCYNIEVKINMIVEELYEKSYCDNCEEYIYAFEIKTKDGIRHLTLCKKCLLELLKAIIER